MVIGIIGESCTGKSTLAACLQKELKAEVFSGKDYLRLAKNGLTAKEMFAKKLQAAMSGENVIYVIAEKEQLALLPEGAIRILVTADLETIRERFARRMHGTLPAAVATMLEKKHGCFDQEPHAIHVISGESDLEEICKAVLHLCGKG